MTPFTRLEAFERRTAIPMLVLAVLSIAILVYDLTVTAIPERTTVILGWLDIGISVVFAWEYGWSMHLAGKGNRLEFARTHVIDALAIVPVFQPLRIFRSLRILRSMRIARGAVLLGKGVSSARTRFHPGTKDIPWLVVVSGVIVALGSALVYGIERNVPGASITTLSDAMWWGMTTATTVGSSLEPVTVEGRAIALGLMLLGISLIAGMAGIFADTLLRTDEGLEERMASLEGQLTRIEHRLKSDERGGP